MPHMNDCDPDYLGPMVGQNVVLFLSGENSPENRVRGELRTEDGAYFTVFGVPDTNPRGPHEDWDVLAGDIVAPHYTREE